jgi:hypothetical protein
MILPEIAKAERRVEKRYKKFSRFSTSLKETMDIAKMVKVMKKKNSVKESSII